MKVAIITDTHFGAKNDHPVVQDYFAEFYEKIFFPELQSRGIKTIIHGGDVFDRRKYVNFRTWDVAAKSLLNKVHEYGMEMHAILGNHDCYYKNTNDISSADILNAKESISMYEVPTELTFGSLKVLLLPWLSPENTADFMNQVKSSNADWMIGHLELVGFDMHKGQPCEHGQDSKVFSKFEKVLTGHFHTQSTKDNIQYLGSPYEMTWIDHEDPKGFHILDTETRTLEFVKNPLVLHHKLYYHDNTDYTTMDFNQFKNKVVKLIVEKKDDHAKFDRIVDAVNKAGPLNFTIVEDMSVIVTQSQDATKDVGKDTLTLIDEYIDDIENEVDTDRLKQIMKNLYNEAQQ